MANELTTKERIAKLRLEEQHRAAFAAYEDVLRLIDLSSSSAKTYTTYSRDSLRSYLQNPASESNQKSLRKLSRYLRTVSHVYRRIISNKANQCTCKNWIAYPKVNNKGKIDNKAYTNYEKVRHYVKNMQLHTQMHRIMTTAWTDDVVYGFCYGDPEQGDFFIHLLDPDYCKISSQSFYGGVYNFAFDFGFFSGANEFYLETYDPIFKKMYNTYQSDSTQRWQELPIERTFCIKINDENPDYPIPPFSGMFDSLISLSDLQQIQDLKDELSAYKLVWAKIDTISGSKNVDDFSIDLELANSFYQKIQSAVPENVALALSPMELNSIDFASNAAEDTNIINKAYQNLVEANGDIVSNSNKITNSTSFKLALMADSMSAMAPVAQINAWINLYIRNNLNIDNVLVEFSNVSRYFEDDRIDLLLKVAQYGVPVKMQLASLLGLDPSKCQSMEFLEDKLGLSTSTWIAPLMSSNVQTAAGNNTNEKEERELTDEGEATRDKK